MNVKSEISIDLNHLSEGLKLVLYARRASTLFDVSDAEQNNEARYQLLEGNFYEYELTKGFYFDKDSFNIVQPSRINPNTGILSPNIYVGTLTLIICNLEDEKIGRIRLEVQSLKTDYRQDYRDMLEYITEKTTDLLLQAESPVSHHFEVDPNTDSQTLYQRFSFIKSIINTDEFTEAVHRIVTRPVTNWSETIELKDIRNTRRFTQTNIKELVKGSNRNKLPENHSLRNVGLKDIPERISYSHKIDSIDAPENRFVKYALEVFLKFCVDFYDISKERNYHQLKTESALLIETLEEHLNHLLFKEVSRAQVLKLNSPVLQRKEGYREVLRTWLMFDLAAKLIWKGGNDIYSAGQKNIAVLYEYWLFFILLDLFQKRFNIPAKELSELIIPTDDGLSLQVKQGKHTPLEGVFEEGGRRLNFQFNYNKTFSAVDAYPKGGSWTTTLRPDYTISIWPEGIDESQAEKEELIVHIHFDAKYKVANLIHLINRKATEEELNNEKVENRKGDYKNADLLKMHAYKDAIRRTGGAYVLYPGEISQTPLRGFHEIIPGLGAFSVNPSKKDNGTRRLEAFIDEVIHHFLNRTSQREKAAYSIYDIHKSPPDKENYLNEPLPEPYGENRGLLPDQTNVLVGFYDSKEIYKWIQKEKIYNFRTGTQRGSLLIDGNILNSRYILLHTHNDNNSDKLWKIDVKGAKIWTKEDLNKKGYPGSDKPGTYLIFELQEVKSPELKNLSWDFKKLKNYKGRRSSAIPFVTTLAELMQCKSEIE